MFENLDTYSKGHILGYITDGNTFPAESVQDCNNMDFNIWGDERRRPYRKHADSDDLAALLEDYTIIGLYEKRFIDGDNNFKDILVAVVKHTESFHIKVYVNQFYNPSTAYGNGNGEGAWVESWTDITEGYQISSTIANLATTTPDPLVQGFTIAMTAANEEFLDKPEEYYRGWFMYSSGGVCVGQITSYTYTGVVGAFSIGVNSVVSGGTTVIAYPLANGQGQFSFVRYPVLDFSKIAMINGNGMIFPKETISGITQAASAVITIPNTHIFNVGDTVLITGVVGMTQINNLRGEVTARAATTITVDIDSTGFSAYSSAGQVYKIVTECESLSESSMESSFNAVKILLGNGLRPFELSFLQQKKFWTVAETDAFLRSWDGFWFGYDIPDVENIDEVVVFDDGAGEGTGSTYFYDYSEFGRELGVRLKLMPEDQIVNFGVEDPDRDYVNNISAFCITFDGFQAIFLKYFMGGRWLVGSGASSRHVYKFNFELHLLVDFDRRITSFNKFMDGWLPATQFLKKEMISFMMDVEQGGIIKTDAFENVGTLNYYTNSQNTQTWMKREGATGLTLNTVLNQKYYHSPVSAFRFLFKIGDNFIAADINKDYLETESQIKDNYGASKIVLSNIQFLGDGKPVSANSCFGEERIRHLIQGERLTAGIWTIGNKFLLFTSSSLYAYEIEDIVAGKISENFSNYLGRGTHGLKTIVKAQVGDQFAGVYWLGMDTIYRMFDTAPEDMLYERWKDEYQAIPEADKQSAVCGFNSISRDVYFVIGNAIYLWNLQKSHWKKYTFSDTPETILTSKDGEITFVSGNNIYTTLGVGTEEFLDETSDGEEGIPFGIVCKINNGLFRENKIPDLLEIHYDEEHTETGGEPHAANILVQVGGDGLVANYLDKEVSIPETTKYNTQNQFRYSCKESRVAISSDGATEHHIKSFTLKEFFYRSKRMVQELIK